jgi:DNA polymerase III alpha subunit (gram-positive type)
MASARIYLDTEYCYPGMTETTGRPTSADKRQIVQISAIRFSTDEGVEEASFDQLVVPAFEKPVPPFFVELTGITQADIDREGAPFPEVIVRFRDFCADTPIWTFEKDQEVIEQNLGYYGMKPMFDKEFVRVADRLKGWGVDRSQYSSGTLYQAVGLRMDGHVHNALHDVRSMAAAVRLLEHRAAKAG